TLPLEACEIAVRGMAERIPAVRGRSGSTKKPTFRTRASHRLRRAKKQWKARAAQRGSGPSV
ncbi:MAG: hypothetical protein U0904_03510, partial [Candidatus Nanopelagicales bacterium]|nr:hypothetical protein [Candidatus Nanopelagicales bacterium]